HRGPDALDFWSSWGWTRPAGDLGASLDADFLQQGSASLWRDEDSLENLVMPLSGVVEREARVALSTWRRVGDWTFRVGVGGSRFWNDDHIPGNDRWVGSVFGGVGWTF
ncbi:MAG TPA: hypothetical protein VN931_07940, partial [Fibrobacteria bacterium]|nr:hypothetical protein [Fibrobacteria bacterium]